MQSDGQDGAPRGISLDLTAGMARVIRLHLEDGKLQLTIEAELDAIELERYEALSDLADGAGSAPVADSAAAEMPPREATPEERLQRESEEALEAELGEELELPGGGSGDRFPEIGEEEDAWSALPDAGDVATASEDAFDAATAGMEAAGEDSDGRAAPFGEMQSTFAPALEDAPPEAVPHEDESGAFGAFGTGAPAEDLEEEDEETSGSLFPSLEEEIGADLDWSGKGESPEETVPEGAGPGAEDGERAPDEAADGDEGRRGLQDVLSAAEEGMAAEAGDPADTPPPAEAPEPATGLRHGEPEPEPEWAPAMGGAEPEETARARATADPEAAVPGLSDAVPGAESDATGGEPPEAAGESPPSGEGDFGSAFLAGLDAGDAATEEDEVADDDDGVKTGIFGRTDPAEGSSLFGGTGQDRPAETPEDALADPGGAPAPDSAEEPLAGQAAGYQAPSTILDRNPFTRETEVGHSEPEPPPGFGFQQETIIQAAREEEPSTADPSGAPSASDSGSAIFDSAAFMERLGAQKGPSGAGAEEPPAEEPKPTASDSGAFEDTARIVRDALSGVEALTGESPDAEPEPPSQPEPLPRSGLGAFGQEEAPGEEPPAKSIGMVKYVCPRCKTPGMQEGEKVGSVVTCETCGKAMRLTMKKA